MLIDERTDRPMGYIGDKSAPYVSPMPVSLTGTLSRSLTSSCMHDAGLLLEPTPGAAGFVEQVYRLDNLELDVSQAVRLLNCSER